MSVYDYSDKKSNNSSYRCFIVIWICYINSIVFRKNIAIIGVIYQLLSILIILKILKDSTRIFNDLPWIILILLFPIFGTILLITLSSNYARSKLLKSIFESEKEYQQYLKQDARIRKEIDENGLDNFLISIFVPIFSIYISLIYLA